MFFKITPIPYLKKDLIYKSEKEIEKGDIVSIFIGEKEYYGLIIDKIKEEDLLVNFKIREIGEIIIKRFYSEKDFEFFKKFSEYNIIDYSLALSIGIPSYIDKIKFLENNESKLNPNLKKDINLTEKQQEIYNKINISAGFKVNLIHGITGSGKTAIYLKIANDIINLGMQVLILVPQIALSHEIGKNIKDLIGIDPIIWHSKITTKKKKEALSMLLSGKPGIFIGARSAFILPYKNLGLIIIDEEHDESYKQNESPVYNARDMAILYSNKKEIPIILGSATPSIDSIFNIEKKGFVYHYLGERFHKTSKYPKIEVFKHFPAKNKIFHEKIIELIKDEIKNGGQCLIFINRRGHSRSVYCSECKNQPKCDNCDNFLSFHKIKNLLKCHYCGHVENFKKKCKTCNSESITEYGNPGVEKIKELIESEIKDAKTGIISSDTINNFKNIEKMTEGIRNNDFNIIIGTEIISKGYHFPNLNFVCILDISTGSYDGDIKCNERLFQLLTQLIGRAGRESDSGRVFIQTTDPSNKIIKFTLENDSHGFYRYEIDNRKKFKLPPFSSFISIMIFSEINEHTTEEAKKIKNFITDELSIFPDIKEKVLIFGPSDSYIRYMKRFHRQKILIQMPKDSLISSKIKDILSRIKTNHKKIFIKIDVDPYSFI